MRILLVLLAFLSLLLDACHEKHPGTTPLDDLVDMELVAFGDSTTILGQSKFVHLEVSYATDTGLVTKSNIVPTESLNAFILNESIRFDLLEKCTGDIVKYYAPIKSFAGNHELALSSEQPAASNNDELEITFNLIAVIANADSLKIYLEQCARDGIMEETTAIRYWELVCECEEWKNINDLSFAYRKRTNGDSIYAGREIHIKYTTHLLSGKQLDSETDMHFTFGKPGQLIQGFQWGLAKLKEGEHARIFMPSIWGFGEDGIPDGPVPPRTPVYIDVQVIDVK